MSQDLTGERISLSGALNEEAYQHLLGLLGYKGFQADGETYLTADDEDYAVHGYDPQQELLIKRTSDGQCFEVETEISVRRVPS